MVTVESYSRVHDLACTLTLQLMDECGSRQMNFRSFAQLFGIMSRTTLQERLKLLYTLHVEELTCNGETAEKGRGSLENSSNTSQTGERISVTFELLQM